MNAAPILDIRDVRVHFQFKEGPLLKRRTGVVRAVDGVSLSVQPGETVGLVGESGCGKSTLARSIVRLVEPTSGTIQFGGRDLASVPRGELRALRPSIQMVFQDPYASLNPRMTVFDALAEPMLAHGLAARGEVAAKVAALMSRVGLAARWMRKYPHEFSGGQRQRIAIARALALRPKLIIADEPVSALDVSVQAQILNLIAELCREEGLSLLLISHDLSVVKHLSDRIAVMYLGRIVELGAAEDVYYRPMHPYTRALINAVPIPDPSRKRDRAGVLLQGDPPSPLNPPAGCAFHPRCPFAQDKCKQAPPPLERFDDARHVACVRAGEIGL
ncbi:MAG: ATP-binding cassette domain-containing protein [Candidatus Hydrogenedentes bacterium]|nr:ATP-binding cassette domain-containing protein [Candidatus Hydrogenedentota bacterium]